MRADFSGYFPLPDELKKRAWTEGLVVLDTNVLLNLYRFGIETRQSLLSAMGALTGRLWLPEQIATEFHENRVAVIREQQKTVESLIATISDLTKINSGRLRAHARNPAFDIDELTQVVNRALSECANLVADAGKTFSDAYGVTPQNDPILLQVGQLYNGNVGASFSDSELADLYEEAKGRYTNKVPPGYKDDRKHESRKYGDYLLWRQIIDHAKEQAVDVILVTDDEKEDWWWISEGQTLGPRPQLRQEFRDETGREIILTKTPSFLKEAGERGLISVESDSVNDAEEFLTREIGARAQEELGKIIAYQTRLANEIRVAEADLGVRRAHWRDFHASRNDSVHSDADAQLQRRIAEIEHDEFTAYREAADSNDPSAKLAAIHRIEELAERRRRLETSIGVRGRARTAEQLRQQVDKEFDLKSAMAEEEAHLEGLREQLRQSLTESERLQDEIRDQEG